jgi:hypothetical protein
MDTVTLQGINRRVLDEQEDNAVDILLQLPLSDFKELKQRLELDIPGVVGPTTLSKFINFCQEKGLDLTESGVN